MEGVNAQYNQIESEVNSYKELLNGIPAKLRDVDKSVQSLEAFLNVSSVSFRREQRENASKMVDPLRILFTKLAQVAPDDVRASIEEGAPSVSLDVSTETVQFTYSSEWKVVMVESTNLDIVMGILSSDTGEVLPDLTNIGNREAPSFANSLKRPFQWAQYLGEVSPQPADIVLTAKDTVNRMRESLLKSNKV